MENINPVVPPVNTPPAQVATTQTLAPQPEFPQAAPALMPVQNNKKRIIPIIGTVVLVLIVIGTILSLSKSKGDEQPAAGTEPSKVAADLLWQAPTSIDTTKWAKATHNSPGEVTYQLAGTRCGVLFQQPDGLKAKGITSVNKVLDDSAAYLSKGLASGSEYYAVAAQSLVIPAATGSDTFSFTVKSVTFKASAIKAEVIAYQNGDFALIVLPVCSSVGEFDANLISEVVPFIKSFKVVATY